MMVYIDVKYIFMGIVIVVFGLCLIVDRLFGTK